MPIQHVGRPIKRLEDPKLVQGRDAYVNDVRLDGALSLAFARSPHAHAVIRRIDSTAAKKIPGVVAVLMGAEIDHTRTHSPRTTLGVKGIGEAATIGSTPAIANAVMDALAPLGVTHVDLPLTPQKIWSAMGAARKR